MKKFIFIPDSFKGSLSSARACQLMQQAVEKECPGADCISIPVADGGEGTVDAFLAAVGGQKMPMEVTGPWGEKMQAYWGLLSEKTGVVEMAAAAGLPLVGDQKNPEKTTTYGVGEMIADALDHGVTEIILGLGGSATNDGGCGAAAAVVCTRCTVSRQLTGSRSAAAHSSTLRARHKRYILPPPPSVSFAILCAAP